MADRALRLIPPPGGCDDEPLSFLPHVTGSGAEVLAAGRAGMVALVLPGSPARVIRASFGRDLGALTLPALTWPFIPRPLPERTRDAAAVENPGRVAVGASVLVPSVLSLVAAARVIGGAWCRYLTVVGGWFLTHPTSALRYAHLLESGGDMEAGPNGDLERFRGPRHPPRSTSRPSI